MALDPAMKTLTFAIASLLLSAAIVSSSGTARKVARTAYVRSLTYRPDRICFTRRATRRDEVILFINVVTSASVSVPL